MQSEEVINHTLSLFLELASGLDHYLFYFFGNFSNCILVHEVFISLKVSICFETAIFFADI